MQRKFKFLDYINCLEVAQTQNQINHLEKKNTDVDSLKEGKKELIERII